MRPIQTGTEIYSRELITALVHQPTPHRYRLYCDRDARGVFPDLTNADTIVIQPRRGWTHLGLGGEIRRRPPALLFVPSHVIPIGCQVPSVVTIHDVGYLWHRSAYRPAAWILLHLGTLWNTRAARLIIADSQATANDLTAHFGVKATRIRVAHLGGPVPMTVVVDYSCLARFRLPRRYIAFVGTLQPRKNLARLLRAFAIVCRSGVTGLGLVLAGNDGPGAADLRSLARELGIADRVVWPGYVSDRERQMLVAGARVFVLPSLYEGFGMPALEAMAWGTPVVTSSSSSLPEVVGDTGVLIDPFDEHELAGAIGGLLDDSARRDTLVARARERAGTFTWGKCAARVAATFDEVLGG